MLYLVGDRVPTASVGSLTRDPVLETLNAMVRPAALALLFTAAACGARSGISLDDGSAMPDASGVPVAEVDAGGAPE